MSLFTRARRHVDMNRVKEMREEKIKEKKIAEVKEQQEEILAELKKIEIKESPKYSNWRREINETLTMTTAGMGMVNLAPNEFDVGAEANKNASTHPTLGADGTLDPSTDYWMMNNAPDEGNSGITISLEIDLSLVDSIDAQIYFTNATIDPAHGMDIIIEGPIGSSISPQIVPVSVPGSGSGSAAPRIVINKDLRVKNAIVSYSVIGNGGGGREIGTDAIQITSTVIYRRAPVNVLVSLDDPDALSFIRGGLGGSKERRERLKDMLDAGNEWMQYLGLEPSKTTPGDIASDATAPGMGTGDQAGLSLAAGLVASPMGQMALAAGAAAVATLLGITIQKAQEVVNQANSMNMSTDYGAGPGRETLGPLPGRGGTSGGRELTPQQQAEVEAAGNELRDARRALEDLPDDASDEQRIQAQERLGRATKNRQRVRNKHKQENKNRKD